MRGWMMLVEWFWVGVWWVVLCWLFRCCGCGVVLLL